MRRQVQFHLLLGHRYELSTESTTTCPTTVALVKDIQFLYAFWTPSFVLLPPALGTDVAETVTLTEPIVGEGGDLFEPFSLNAISESSAKPTDGGE